MRLGFRFGLLLLLATVAMACIASRSQATDENAAVDARIAATARYLASDELEGRGLGTRGLDLAANFLAQQFAANGLQTNQVAGGPFQPFPVTAASEVGPNNRLELLHADRTTAWKCDQDYVPMTMGGSGKLDLPLVFAGYGITAKDQNFDDYAGLDVRGKAVVVLRHEPEGLKLPKAAGAAGYSQHALFQRKVENALEHGAAAVVFCTDQPEIRHNVAESRRAWQTALDRLAEEHARLKQVKDPSPDETDAQRRKIDGLLENVRKAAAKLQAESDPLLSFGRVAHDAAARSVPIVHCRRKVIDPAVQTATGKRLDEIEAAIGTSLHPQSKALGGWRLRGEVEVIHRQSEAKNVIGMLPGSGPLADETIVVGAHYDHLGWGGFGSLAPGVKAIHHGADDNASGVSALVEIARQLAMQTAAAGTSARRRLVFIAFSGEERGILGSSYYVTQPRFPLDKTVAMLNLDMVGRLRDDKLTVTGTGTSATFGQLLDQVNARHGLKLQRVPDGYGPSDHLAFSNHQVPVLFFFTGTHDDYHRPSDTFDKLNVPGIRRIVLLATDLVGMLSTAAERPHYIAVGNPGDGAQPVRGSFYNAGAIEATPALPVGRENVTSRSLLIQKP